ncbi:ferritin-like domain-containing protein [Roseibacillus ishigakijimensis]|uniref:PA2169 family four-helix-bundle protein n=1 Tax=Roseibacillus ishigakijimensis TaxID=454146 RepID=A0A934RPG3_9BACT|nr:PA2169 family four-helix-bundle protein [Roseibacillus ishigakijimensis]MBK1833083.1 PA2169 family four-helix-bundle protein [Roseibacillus ishigakijimensis]
MKMTPLHPQPIQTPEEIAKVAAEERPTHDRAVQDYLQQLHQRTRDAIKGYRKAAEMVSQPQLQTFLSSNAEQRTLFEKELASHLQSLDVEPGEHSSLPGRMHRTWMSLVETFSGDESALLRECERGEEAAVNDYEEALSSFRLPPEIAGTIERQRDQVREDLRRLKTLELTWES